MIETLYCAIIIALYFIVRFLQHTILSNREKRGYAALNILFDIVIFVGFLICIGAVVGFDFSTLKVNFKEFVETQSSRLIWTIVVIIITSTIIGILKTLLFRKKKNSRINEKRSNTMSKVLMSLAKYFLYIVCIIVILGIWGVNILPALAGLGIVGLVVGLGAQKLINDFVAGIFIVFEHHFDVGDTIEVGGFKGEVIDIGLKTTKIKNWQGRVKIIANGELTNLINDTTGTTSFDIIVEVAYTEDINHVMQLFNEAFIKELSGREEIIEIPQTKGVNNLGCGVVGIKIVGTTKAESHYQLSRDMLGIITQVCKDNNIQLPFNKVVLYQGKE